MAAECVHRQLCPNDCPCDYYEESEWAELVIDYQGSCVTWSHCSNCGQPVQYPTYNSYNLCPYCGKRVRYK